MFHHSQRARRRPGPLVFAALGLLLTAVFSGAIVRAHDPGLSALEITVRGTTIVASVAVSPADVAQLPGVTSAPAPQADSGVQRAVRDLVRDAVRLSFDGELLPLDHENVELGPDGARVRLSYARVPSSLQVRRMTVTSNLPARLARGHRQLLVVTADGHVVAERVLDATGNTVDVDLVVSQPSIAQQAWSFFTLGLGHILSGYDHLVFLAGLILGAGSIRGLVVALSAFTVAHSLSLALVVLGGVVAPPAIVEPLIAASIAWVGVENLLRDRFRARWWLVFAFGLIHGFGFAGALTELGLGSRVRDVAVALLSFNGGVEAGQLLVAAAMWPLAHLLRARPVWQARLMPLCSMLIVIAGGCWLIERLLSGGLLR